MAQILHITAHMGGGVGKAINALVEQSANSKFNHNIVCLERPIKKLSNQNITVSPSPDKLETLIKESDIVQIEWWNHPTLIKYLKSQSFEQPMRVITWCHNNGLYNIPKSKGKLPPIIPKSLIKQSQYFIFTNDCSYQCKEVQEILKENPGNIKKLGVIYSSGGFSNLPNPQDPYYFSSFSQNNISVGYFGSFNFTKLHPDFVKYISSVNINRFKVKMIGEYDSDIRKQLIQQCNELTPKQPNLLQFTGYIKRKEDLIKELSSINIISYLLNPTHYGTTENALLECMSMGIVPIVLDNLPERFLVEDNKTGFIIKTPKEFANIIHQLNENPDKRQKMGLNASKHVRTKFSIEKTVESFNNYYTKLMNEPKRIINFREIFNGNI